MSLNHFQFVTIILADELKDDRQDPDRFPSLYIGFFVLLHGSQSRWWTSVVCWFGFCVGFFKASCCVSVSLNVEASATQSPLSVTTVCFVFRISPFLFPPPNSFTFGLMIKWLSGLCYTFRLRYWNVHCKEQVQYFIQMFKGSHITEDTGPKTWFLKSSFNWVVFFKLIRATQLHTQSVFDL